MDRKRYVNIKEIEHKHLTDTYTFAFTYTIPSACYIAYKNNKGHMTKRHFGSIPHRAQCHFLAKSMLPQTFFYFEQHKDFRYHMHGYVECTALDMLNVMKACFEDIRCAKIDVQDKLFLCEIVSFEPQWVEYCRKYQSKGFVYNGDIDQYIINFLDFKKEEKTAKCANDTMTVEF